MMIDNNSNNNNDYTQPRNGDGVKLLPLPAGTEVKESLGAVRAQTKTSKQATTKQATT
jgi:hypothetical protein